jgi:NAD(P)-dependent dehydrogenase (short-subunit alcohol dehydrogenase family)
VQACDLAQDADIDGLAGTLDRLDMLVHNAALYERGTVESAPVAAFDAQYAINVRAPFLLTQRVLPLLQAAQGEIAFVNSTVIGGHTPELAHYSATKQALLGLANSLRAEVNPQGIRVLSVFVGRTATPMQERAARDTGNAYQPEKLLQPDDVASAILHAFALPRTAEITDLTIRPRQK